MCERNRTLLFSFSPLFAVDHFLVLCCSCCVGVGGGAAPRLGWTGWGLGLGLWWRCSLEWAQKQVSGFGVGRGGEWEEADRGFVCRKQEELRTRRSDAGSDMQFLTRGVSVGRNRVFSYEAVCCRGSKEVRRVITCPATHDVYSLATPYCSTTCRWSQ